MSNEVFSNDLDIRIEAAVQCMMHNLISSDSSANTISFLIFKLQEIEYYDSELDTQYDEENIVTIKKDSYT